jgi:hypothetical protein
MLVLRVVLVWLFSERCSGAACPFKIYKLFNLFVSTPKPQKLAFIASLFRSLSKSPRSVCLNSTMYLDSHVDPGDAWLPQDRTVNIRALPPDNATSQAQTR